MSSSPTANQNNSDERKSSAVGAALYYGITALVVVAIIATVIGGKFFYRRKHRAELRRRNDIERQNAIRRGEANGLPTYGEHGHTIALSMPTVAYPEGAHRRDSANGGQPGVEADMASRADPSLPTYEASAPPKYDYATSGAGNNNASTGPVAAVQRAAANMLHALGGSSSRPGSRPSSRPGSIRRANSSNAASQLPTMSTMTARTNNTVNGAGQALEMQQTNSTPRVVMTSAPVMYTPAAAASSGAPNQSTTSVNSMQSAVSQQPSTTRTITATNSNGTEQEEEEGAMHVVSLDDEQHQHVSRS